MKILVLTNSEDDTVRRLGFDTTHYIGDYAKNYNDRIILRWGNRRLGYNSQTGERTTEYRNVINRSKFIGCNVDKLKALKLLAQVVNVPTIYEKSVPKDVLAVVRPFAHAAGNDFSVKEGPFKIEPETYGTKFIPTDTEVRVWFCGEKTLCGRRVKMKRNEEPGPFPCRSNWGYEFAESVPLDLHHQTLMAAKQIGLECGAADVLYSKGKWYFLELNSGVAVDHRKEIDFFRHAIVEYAMQKFPQAGNIPVPVSKWDLGRPVQPTSPVVQTTVQPVNARPSAVQPQPTVAQTPVQKKTGVNGYSRW